jgi:hypothetical protein
MLAEIISRFHHGGALAERRSSMVKNSLWRMLLIWPGLVFAQSGFDVTGRISLRMQNTEYDQHSDLRPDSISSEQYGKTTVIPGWQQMLNISLFGRVKSVDVIFLADLKNNQWNRLKFSDYNSIPRVSLSLNWSNQTFVAGDFFDSYSELFILSREVRGSKYHAQWTDIWNKDSFLEVSILGGIVQKAIAEGSRTDGLYKQFETARQYRRWMGAGIIKFGRQNYFDLSLNYLYGKDQQSSINTSLNLPLKNNVYGGAGNFYLWERNIRLFAEFYQSIKDTLQFSQARDRAYYGGLDFRYQALNVIVLYENLGADYFTVGYPYLENDKRGVKGKVDYAFPEIIMLNTDFEFYKDNLSNKNYQPTASIALVNAGFTTLLTGWPELTVRYGWRTDRSNTVFDPDRQPFKTDRLSTKIEGRLAFNLNRNRFSLSAIKLNLEDKSLIAAILPLSTRQFITGLTYYSSAVTNLYFTVGALYSQLKLSNNQQNINLYLYETNRWNIIPQRLILESTANLIQNDASNGGTQDMLNDYFMLQGELSLEYFFSGQLSFKIIVGTDNKKYQYNLDEARMIISNPEYGPAYFNGYESYKALITGGEINWIF